MWLIFFSTIVSLISFSKKSYFLNFFIFFYKSFGFLTFGDSDINYFFTITIVFSGFFLKSRFSENPFIRLCFLGGDSYIIIVVFYPTNSFSNYSILVKSNVFASSKLSFDNFYIFL